jgi:hypothetical protein
MTRRMTLVVLVLVGLMVLAVTIFPPRDATRGGAQEVAATPSPAASAPLTDPDAFDVSGTFLARPGATPHTLVAEVGDRVEITVKGTSPDSVALGDLGMDDLEAGVPARFELLADTPGTYPLVLTNDSRRIGALEIR